MDLTEDEVLQILNLIEKSSFDFFQLELGDLKLTVSKGPLGASVVETTSTKPAVSAKAAAAQEAQTKAPATDAKPKTPAIKEGTVPIVAPMVGTFYLTPEPGAPPFIKIGDRVDAGTTVGLIEVMKVFNAVSAGVPGVIAESCVEGGQFVEYGQTLFLVKPDGKGAGG